MRLYPGLILMLLACWGCDAGSDPADDSATPASIARGRALYVQHCALCHGARADGRGVRSQGLVGKPVDFTSRAWRARMSRADVDRAIRQGKPGTSMASWRLLGDDAVRDLTSYVMSVGEAQP